MAVHIPGPENAVFFDANHSDCEFGAFVSQDITRREAWFDSDSRRFVVWGSGTIEGDVFASNGIPKDRVQVLDLKDRPLKNRRRCGVVQMKANRSSEVELNQSGAWRDYPFLPGVRIMWLDNCNFYPSKIEDYFESI